MKLTEHINTVTRTCFHHLHNMYKICQCVNEEAAKTMVHALITSRLDYCNSLFYGLPKCHLKKLEMVQRAAARFISMTRKYDHITPTMRKLHWLPIESRIVYKTLLITFKAMNSCAPTYISELLVRRKNKGTRQDNKLLLEIPKIKTKSFRNRAFPISAPTLWNTLPADVRSLTSTEPFKQKLKTHIFRLAYT